MSTATRVPLAEARAIALELVDALLPGCRKIVVAGSIRRGKPDVGDIELVAIPTTHLEREGLWGEVAVNELDQRINALIGSRVLAPHPDDPKRGERYSKVVHVPSGMQVDLFSASAERFGLILLIRTGPDSYSQRLVTEARRVGHHVKDGELHSGGPFGCPRDCVFVPTPDEESVYRALGMTWVAPEARL